MRYHHAIWRRFHPRGEDNVCNIRRGGGQVNKLGTSRSIISDALRLEGIANILKIDRVIPSYPIVQVVITVFEETIESVL